MLDPLQDYWGTWHRILTFVHDEWVARNGVWRETERARALRAKGQAPAPRWNPQRLMAPLQKVERYPHGPRCYPAVVCCPECKNKRRLDAAMLHVVSLEDVRDRVERRALREGLVDPRGLLESPSRFGPVLVRDADGAPVALSRRAQNLMRDVRSRRAGRMPPRRKGEPETLLEGEALEQALLHVFDEMEQAPRRQGSSDPAD